MEAVSSNEFDRLERWQAHVTAVVTLDGEMLVELVREPARPGAETTSEWLVGPTNGAALMALSRWYRDEAIVRVHRAQGRYLLQTEHLRVNVRVSAAGPN